MKPARSYSAAGIQPRHLRRLAADQRAAVLLAAARDPAHHLRRHLRIQFSHREVVQEKQRHGALHRDVVDAVVHQVFAHRAVPAGQERHLQLGADAVGGTHQHRLAITRQLVHRSEAADFGQDAGGERLPREFLDGGNGAIGLVDIHARVAVANWFFSGQIPVYGVEFSNSGHPRRVTISTNERHYNPFAIMKNLVTALFLCCALAFAQSHPAVAIRNAKIVTVSRPRHQQGHGGGSQWTD